MKALDFPKLGERCYCATLPSGLTLYVIPKREFSRTYAFLATKYGGQDQRYLLNGRPHNTPAGVAHFLEHKMFDLPEGNALQILSARGARPNAFTSYHMTAYHFSCTDQVYENLRTLVRLVTIPWFTAESVDKERGIIAQEIRMREDDPALQCYLEILGSLYVNHTVRSSILGTVESIGKITPEVLENCHKAFYHPSNLVLCVMGNVQPREVERIAASLIPVTPAPKLQRFHGEPEPAQSLRQEVRREMEVSVPLFMLGFKAAPEASLRRRLIGELAGEMLCGPSSPLYARLYQEGSINRSFEWEFASDGETARLVFSGESDRPEAVAEAILAECVRIAWDGLEEPLFQRVKKAMYGRKVCALNRFEDTCRRIAQGHFTGYQYLDFASVLEEINRHEVEDFLRETVTAEKSALSMIYPKGGALL